MSDLNINVKKLRPFTRFMSSIGALPTSYLISMTYQEQLTWFCNYLEKTVIPAINNNGLAIEELQAKYIELKNYVDHYFDNLDVQQEIDNKLDDMAESGQLADIIAQYLELAGVLAYNTVSDMKNADNLTDGSICLCLGHTTYNDGEGSYYKIREIINTDIVDEVNIISLNNSNTLIAEKINNFVIYKDLENYLPVSYGDGDHLGIGNKTYTSTSAWTSTVASVRANREETQPAILKSAPSNFAPSTSQGASQYRGRDSVALFIGNQSKNADFKQPNANGITYGENYVTYLNDNDVPYFKIGCIIDTYHDNQLSGIITNVDTENKRIYIQDGWYYDGVKNTSPTNNIGYQIGKVTKIWNTCEVLTLNDNFDTRNAVSNEIDLYNFLPAGTTSEMIGIDVVSQGSHAADIAFLARSGEGLYDMPWEVGPIRKGFVARSIHESFVSQNDTDDDYLIISKKKDDTHDYTRFGIKNDGTMTNEHFYTSNITQSNTANPTWPNANIKVWLFIPETDINYTLPDPTSSTLTSYDDKEFILCNRSAYNVTLSNGYVIEPYKSAIYITHGVWIRISNT